jgi:hypothetical protein
MSSDQEIAGRVLIPAAIGFVAEIAVLWVLGFFGSLLSTCAQTGVPRCPGFSTALDWPRILLVTVPLFAVAVIANQSPDAEDDEVAAFRIFFAFVFALFLYPVSLINHWVAYGIWGVPFAVAYGKRFISGLHYIFVRHPTEPIITPALRSGDAIDHKALGETLLREANDLGLKPQFHYQNQAKHARAMKEKLDADAEIAEATIRRERARAALLDAEQEVEEAKRRTKDRS